MAKKDKMNNSLKTQMLRMTLQSFTIMTIIIIAVSVASFYYSMQHQIKGELEEDANLALLTYEKIYDGKLRVEESVASGEIAIYKGEERINGDNILLDDLASLLNIDISLIYDDTRIITTIKDESGQRAIGTTVASKIYKEVAETGEPVFYSNVEIYDNASYAYYKPLLSDDGVYYGMIAVCCPRQAAWNDMLGKIWLIILACILAALSIGWKMANYNRKLGERISQMAGYMDKLAHGKFDTEIPRLVKSEDDEIKQLAEAGQNMSKDIKVLVDYDALTKLRNRRSANNKLKEIRIKAEETGIDYCVSIGDIDFFKKVNDTYGHEMGDLVLKEVAHTLNSGMLGRDVAARWGGEEFLLIFENKKVDEAEKILSQILDNIRKIIIPDTDKNITMSFGLTQAKPRENTNEILKRADDRLYEAKESGRNRIIIG